MKDITAVVAPNKAMTLFETAFEKVSVLVNEFAANEEHYLSPKYQEAEVREDFLNKFWIALGWDVRHKYQTNPREQEVKVERNPDSSATSRKADYAFYLKPDYRNPVFFCEAKKPSRKLSDPEFYFQLVRYGRGASTPVGVLTDFEEFHIIDCRYEPNLQKSYPSAQIKTFVYKDYLDRENFGYIYWLFSREAIEGDKLKEFARGLPKQRGAGKAKLTVEESKPVDEAFLTKLEEYRLTLAKAFKKADESLTAEDLTEATQKVIDRLVFVRFLEDKNIESDYIVDQIAAKKGGAWKSFINWSKELDVKYNGIVFKPHAIDKPSFVAPDDKVFAELCNDISHRNSKYLFSYIPIEILGSIYERFLGKVVTATAKRADIEYKPEVRKAGGVYYTPKYIVDYIVSNTVGKLIEGKKPKEISSMRFADIACGSGSFLISVYDIILHSIEKYYNGNPSEAIKAGCLEIDKGVYALTLKQKQKILLDNIFGVDIDHQAVEVAQLSLFLKLLESESDATAGQLSFEKTKILPDLSKNIQCGNSLVEYDIEQLFPLLPEDFERIKPFDFNTSFKQVMENDGFDAIVGNPPYGGLLDENTKSYIKRRYKSYQYKYDTYLYFIDRAIQLTKKGGYISYITPELWLTLSNSDNIRRIVLENCAFDDLTIWGENVFAQAIVNTVTFVLKKSETNNTLMVKFPNEGGRTTRMDLDKIKRSEKRAIDYRISENVEAILDKFVPLKRLEQYGDTIQGITPYDKYRGQSESIIKSRAYHSKTQVDDSYGKWLAGGDIMRYIITWSGEWLSYGNWLAAPRDPKFFDGERLLFREIPGQGKRIQASFAVEKFYHGHSITPFLLKDRSVNPLFLLGIVNSRLLSWYGSYKLSNFGKNIFPKLNPEDIKALPIPNFDATRSSDKLRHDELVSLVEQMLSSKQYLAATNRDAERDQIERKCEYLDSQIDKLVYALYGLTAEEIRIVEHG
ncbi:MAG: N-6 DNA methylase [Bacteroidota bacterium]|nr:N-6 DNA methylase [Bacteroidota bacterium]MDP4237096.1 N-6 DNA methylase [Bacteroidota bacterium]